MRSLLRSRLPVVLSFASAIFACSSSSDHPANPNPGPSTTPTADGGAASIDSLDYLIVAANPLSGAADRLKTYRESTGHKVAIGLVGDILGSETARGAGSLKIRDWVKARFDKRDPAKPFFVLLLGDANDSETVDSTIVPAAQYVDPRTKGKVITDNVYADMDGDDIPDLAVGRIPVKSEDEANTILDKTKRFESTYEIGAWNRRLSIFASTAGFTDEIDAEIESVVFKVVEEIPYDFDLNFTYAKQTSPYVYVPEHFSDKIYDRLNEGSLMMTYVGHGSENSFAELDWNNKTFPILDTSKISKIDVTHKAPILSLIACLTGRFTGDSLSEDILKTANGPVAVYSSTEESHPYANAVFIRELAQTVTTEHAGTIGEIFMRGKRRSIENANDPIRQEIDAGVANFITPDLQESLRRSHLYMYTLFGDPAARLGYPKHWAKVTPASATPAAGSALSISVDADGLAATSALVTLETTRSTAPTGIATVPADSDPSRDDVISANYNKANDHVVAKVTATPSGATFQASLDVPAGLAAGDYYVKVYADDGKADAVGSAKVTVH